MTTRRGDLHGPFHMMLGFDLSKVEFLVDAAGSVPAGC